MFFLLSDVEKMMLNQMSSDLMLRLWDDWELRVMVLISLTTQIFLLVMGNRRKYNPGTLLRISIWCAYLTADWVATVALGLLFNKQGTISCTCSTDHIDYELAAFWAPFLLLHLGGQNTITAYAIADTDLWLRNWLALGSQTAVALYVTFMAWKGTWISFLTIPMIFAGVLKYGERSLALRFAHHQKYLYSLAEPPNCVQLIEDVNLRRDEGYIVLPIELKGVADHLSHADTGTLLAEAYSFFQTFKRIFVDLLLSPLDLRTSQSYFRNLTPEVAFKLVEFEHGFAYDVFYTNAPIIYTSWGSIFRFITSVLIIIVFVLFLMFEKRNRLQIDLIITYILLVGAILQEFYAVILLLSSDWTKLRSRDTRSRFFRKIAYLQPAVSQLISRSFISSIVSCFLPSNAKRWSNSLGLYNLLSFSIKDKPVSSLEDKPELFKHIVKSSAIYKKFERLRYKDCCEVSPDWKKLIFEHFKEKSVFRSKAEDDIYIASLCSARGNLVFEKNYLSSSFSWTTQVEFDQSILIWHIATDICYHLDGGKKFATENRTCEGSKNLSDYMVYLLLECPSMLPIGIGKIRFQDTHEEAEQFCRTKRLGSKDKGALCNKLLEVSTEEYPLAKTKGETSKSVLFDARKLAGLLQEMGGEDENKEKKWKFVCDVWIEILGYAACHCRGHYHARQLMKGGEFITHVWLLMAHLGITEQYFR